jgi:DNA-binding FadR family transcriptional regulator
MSNKIAAYDEGDAFAPLFGFQKGRSKVQSALTLRQTILENLQSRTWRAGHRLPTERELSEQYGLSRSTVRRVLAELKGKGLITQTVGSGTYVTEEVGVALAQIASSASPLATSPAELMSARLVLEPAIIAMVVGNATAADFERMDECCAKGESAATIEDFELWDGKLHEAMADAAHNTFIATVFQRMNEVRAQSEWGMLKRRTATPERRQAYEREHRALVAALRDRDGARAAQLCLEHLTHVRRNLLGY